ncbi:gamma-glutamyl hydrolase isoform X1 [Oncorhynchus mykiss]|uniref:gamma-glutamyl hydrolase isoform X1 n=2 Tax=Oncorhynchus mykiss TaxID=8022 RepID=UPI00187894C3|nr:gamma-glutamyl hydrolase isoform X1 [Oncorhynchus mykiss]
MSFTSKLPPSWNDRPPPRKVEIDLSSPGLAVLELERLLFTGKAINSHADEVWPRLYIGDQDSATNVRQLANHHVTHVLNANHSKRRDGAETYLGMNIKYFGIEAHDSCNFDMSVNFQTAADFIHRALSGGGILTQEVEDDVMKPFGKTYIPASYVKYIESAGSRVVPIRLTQSTAEYEKIFKSINGLLLIGGSSDLETSDFAKVAGIFYRLALKANDAGDSFPIWGTCLGMQLLTCLVAGENLLTKTTAENMALPLNLTKEAHSSQMFQGFPSDVMKALSQEALTGNFHQYGVTMKTFKENEKLQSFFSILSTNTAENGAIFVSTMEGRTYPFYGVQWHPEVNRFQWDPKLNFPHSSDAVRVASLLAEFFVNEGRRSLHHFDQPEEEAVSLIYNYTPTYAGNFTGYEQIYFF